MALRRTCPRREDSTQVNALQIAWFPLERIGALSPSAHALSVFRAGSQASGAPPEQGGSVKPWKLEHARKRCKESASPSGGQLPPPAWDALRAVRVGPSFLLCL